MGRQPLSGGTAQPDLMSLWHALKGKPYTLGIDINKILEANAVTKECLGDYFYPAEAQKISPEVILSPMPGGALTANTMMMRDTGTLHLYPKVIEAMSECVAKGGFGTSVTPVSQFYFQQAYANVTQGPWKKITDGYGKMVLGYFGRTPVEPDPDVVKIAEEQMGMPRFTGDPLEIIEPGIPKAKQLLEDEGLPVTDENLFIIGALATPGGNKGLDFLKGKAQIRVRKVSDDVKAEEAVPAAAAPPAPVGGVGKYRVVVDGQSFHVEVEEETGSIEAVKHVEPAPAAEGYEVKAKVPGNVLRLKVSVGERVKQGDTVMVLEAMKMETSVAAPIDGTVAAIAVEEGQVVQAGQLLLTLS